MVEEGHEAHEDWITHIEAAIVAVTGSSSAGTGLAPATRHAPAESAVEAQQRARAEAAAKAAAEAKATQEAEEEAERAADAEDAANEAAERAAAAGSLPSPSKHSQGSASRGAAAASQLPPIPETAPKAYYSQDADAEEESSPRARPLLSNDPDSSGTPPSHGVDPADIAAAQALIRGPSDAPDTLVGWMYKSDPHGR